MLLQDEEAHILTKLGFNQTQTMLYLTLLKMGKATGRQLANQAKVPRSIVYRELDELQTRGLVEKEITQPYTFRATAIKDGLKLLIEQKFEEDKEIEQETVNVLRKIRNEPEVSLDDREYKFVMIDRKERIIQKIKQQHNNAKLHVDILTTLQRWLQILNDCFPCHERAVSRGVQYRVVIDGRGREIRFGKYTLSLISRPNFAIRCSSSLGVNAAIFDGKEGFFSFYPAKPVANSPIIWTNHPSFLIMFQNYFEDTWKTAKVFS